MQDDLEARRKRLIYRSLYTGLKETDLLLGAFARAHLPLFDAGQLDRYEKLLDCNQDPAIYAWAVGRDPVPPEFDTDVMKLLKQFKLGI
jgi:succinate dehydrogenase flavin-adding protein (antitoxin of CptAB toxin-antitoxin module)